MFGLSAATYTLKYNSRCVEAVLGNKDRHQFYVGTLNLLKDNLIYLLEFSEDQNDINELAVFQHKFEVWDISPHPIRSDLLFTCYNKRNNQYAATLYKTPEIDSGDNLELDALFDLPNGNVDDQVKKILWSCDEVNMNQLVAVHQSNLYLYDVNATNDSAKPISKTSTALNKLDANCTGAFDPHHSSEIAVAKGSQVLGFDIRSSLDTPVRTLSNIHANMTIRDLDYNPNKPYYLATGGDDCKVKFWDVRQTKEPVKVLASHSHWISTVQYNRFHDQLVLSTSTDSLVSLWRVSSISSAPLETLSDDEDDPTGDSSSEDALIKNFEDHDDSIYSATWSASDAWVFGSLSFDGHFVINHVPSTEKYRILL